MLLILQKKHVCGVQVQDSSKIQTNMTKITQLFAAGLRIASCDRSALVIEPAIF